MTEYPKPILKWLGGKTQIIQKIIQEFPTEINNYYEIFLGGGSVLFALLYSVKKGVIVVKRKIYAFDANLSLISVYKNIQSKHTELYQELCIIIEEYNNCNENGDINRKPNTIEEATQNKENYYYWIRNKYNQTEDKTTVEASAMFIFLNKTCFRGVFRVGPRGFNVPYGHYKNPEIINKKHLDEINELIQSVVFECRDFSETVVFAGAEDYMYLDPPYVPEKKTSFVEYMRGEFNHLNLFQLLCAIEPTVRFMMSNSDTSFVRETFADYDITTILCKRAIRSKNPDTKTNEVIIKNY